MADVLLHHLEFLADALEVFDCTQKFLSKACVRHHDVVGLQPDLLHALDVGIDHFLLTLALFLEFLNFLCLDNLFLILLLLLLDGGDSLVELGEEVGELRVDLVPEV